MGSRPIPPGDVTLASPKASRDLPRWLRFYRGWWIVGAGFLSQVIVAGASGWILSVLLLPMQKDLGWSRSELVGPLTVASLITGGLSGFAGPLVDRYGSRLIMAGSAFVAGSSLILLGLVTTSWQYYLLLGVVYGLACPGLQNLGPMAAIANWFVRRRAMAFTFASFGAPFTGIVLAPAFAWLAAGAGWRPAWMAMGLIAWCMVPLAWFSVRHRPEDIGLLPDGDKPGTEGGQEMKSEVRLKLLSREAPWTVREALRTRTFWLLVAGYTLYTLPGSSIFVHMASYVVDRGFSTAQAALAIGIYGFGSLAGRVIWGLLLARFGVRRPIMTYGFVYALAIVLFTLPSSLHAIYITTFLLGIGVSGGYLFQSQAYPDYYGRGIVGALQGYTGLFLMVSRAFAPVFAAFVYDTTNSYIFAFLVFAAAAFLAGVAFLLARPPVYRQPEAATVANA